MPSYSTQDTNPTTEFSYPDGYLFHYTDEHGADSPSLFPQEPGAITYTPFQSVKTITEGNNSLSIQYGPDRQRRRMVTDRDGLTTTTLYGRNYERVTSGSEVKHYHYIGSPTGLAAILINGQVYFPLSDHLGSITGLVSSANYTLAEEYSYDAWGRRRNPADWSYVNVPVSVYLTRGFTGHEHLDDFGLINMNGRVYDPLLGRFLSPDNYVQMPYGTQGFNRFGYCLNNPLKYTDPSGELFIWDDVIVGGVGFLYGYISHGLSTGDWGWSAVGSGAISAGTFLLGYYSGGATSAASIAEGFSAISGGHAATAALGYSGRMVAASTISSLLPSASVTFGDATFSVSPAFMIGNGGYAVGINFQVSYNSGDFNYGAALGTSYGKSSFTGNIGFETRLSGYAGYDDGEFGIGLSSTKFWSGETSQRLGRLSMRYDEFSMSYENDGTPFQYLGLGGGTDSYRTASVTMAYRELTIGMLLFTGYRDYQNEIPQKGYPYKMVGNKEINNYNAGILYAGYGNMRAGWNHDNIRHVFQNRFAHSLPGMKQAWIPRKNWPNQPYLVYGANNPYTNW